MSRWQPILKVASYSLQRC